MKNQYGNFDKLMLSINQTRPQKAITELQIRIDDEQSKIQTAQLKLVEMTRLPEKILMDQQNKKALKAVVLSMSTNREYLNFFGDHVLVLSIHFIQMINRPYWHLKHYK